MENIPPNGSNFQVRNDQNVKAIPDADPQQRTKALFARHSSNEASSKQRLPTTHSEKVSQLTQGMKGSEIIKGILIKSFQSLMDTLHLSSSPKIQPYETAGKPPSEKSNCIKVFPSPKDK